MKVQLAHKYNDIISLENLLLAWQEFITGKKHKPDVQLFARNLMDNIISLHQDLKNHTYHHNGYQSFFVNDPKRRHIHKASVRDRLLHHAVYRLLYPVFDRTFISDSFSCRLNKGTHKAIKRFRSLANQVSQNHTRTCWVLKGDIKKFFASIDHHILLKVLNEYVPEKEVMRLLKNIIGSFATGCHPRPDRGSSRNVIPTAVEGSLAINVNYLSGAYDRQPMINARDSSTPPPAGGFARNDSDCVGLPLGNLTSQLFANVYLNVFDQYVKHQLGVGARHAVPLPYIRYADDFVILSSCKNTLANLIPQIQQHLAVQLKLTLHPNKIFIKTLASGVDFLGWVNFPSYHVLRRTTRRRMFVRLRENPSPESVQSYLGLLGHGNTYLLRQRVLNEWWVFDQVTR